MIGRRAAWSDGAGVNAVQVAGLCWRVREGRENTFGRRGK